MRIVSLVPSLTELIIDIGLGPHVVGRTKFCIHPEDVIRHIPKIGGTKSVDVAKVLALQPTHVISNKEENTKEVVLALQQHCDVLVTDISDYDTAIRAMEDIGLFTDTVGPVDELVRDITLAYAHLPSSGPSLSVCYLIWQHPYMTIGHDTFIHSMLSRCGLHNVYEDHLRYPEVTIKDIKARKPDLIFLSSEPFPFRESHRDELARSIPSAQVVLVDGEYFSWYGSRMLSAAVYFKDLLADLGNR